MHYSEIGDVANKFWEEILSYHPYAGLYEYAVMPNHIHGIIEIDKSRDAKHGVSADDIANKEVERESRDAKYRVSTDSECKNSFGPQSKNLSSIIRGFKSGVTKYAKINDIEFKWQAKFYDHIIWNEIELNKIRTYILENPKRWELDKNNPANLFM